MHCVTLGCVVFAVFHVYILVRRVYNMFKLFLIHLSYKITNNFAYFWNVGGLGIENMVNYIEFASNPENHRYLLTYSY